MIPTVGRTVHYVSHGTPVRKDGTQAYTAQCRAAIITSADPVSAPGTVRMDEDWYDVGMCVLNPTGMFFNEHVPYDKGGDTPGDPTCPDAGRHADGPFRYCACGWAEAALKGGTWHWPKRADG
jgi:hypothetical protein